MIPLTLIREGVYVNGDLWDCWRSSFSRPSVSDMCDFVLYSIDDEHDKFVRSLAWRGPRSPV